MTGYHDVNKPFKWTPIIRNAVRLYAQGLTQTVAAEKAGMTNVHLCRCMRHPDVRKFYEEVIFTTGLAMKSELVKSMKLIAEKKITEALENGDKDTALAYMKEIRLMLALDEVQEEKSEIKIVVE